MIKKQNKINVLSTFNGLGSVWIILDRLGIEVNKRYSSEIDKYANIVNDANYPNTIQMGDVKKLHNHNFSHTERIDNCTIKYHHHKNALNQNWQRGYDISPLLR